ncbi:MAG: conjugal transfer protein TrbF [Pseudomonadota bacterium]
MNFAFRSPPRNYAAEPADTPYRRAQQEWDARMGSAVLSARAWLGMAFGALALAAVLACALTAVALQRRTFVDVAEVSPEGQVMSVRSADGAWTPSQAQIAYHIGRFVTLVRSLPTDGVVLRQNWLDAYKYLAPQAAAQLTEIARSDDPFLTLGRVGRTVHVRSIIQRSDHSYEVSWIERETNTTGTPEGEAYSGVFTIMTRPPRTSDEIASNPLGLFITDFSWSRVR